MKKLLYIFILTCFLINICAGQKTKTLKVNSVKPNNLAEKFAVFEFNSHIKHGKYSKKKNNILIEKGFYKYNQKDSLWEYYSLNKIRIAKGYYDNGSKVGVWEYYSFKGNLVQKYNHSNDSLLYYDTLEEQKQFPYLKFKMNENTQVARAIGGISNLYNTIKNDVLYPKRMWDKKETAAIKVYFMIDTLGNTIDVRVMNVKNTEFETEGIRIIESLGKCWMPAVMDNKKVKMSYVLPVNFNIE
ncbi:MAG: energy transducer TonB [Bacteroidota bacterium]|nr:energy transducer TonB [Bacteroidota bacterium]